MSGTSGPRAGPAISPISTVWVPKPSREFGGAIHRPNHPPRQLARFRGEASFKTWLLSITWHQAINRRRSLSRWWRRVLPSGNGDGGDVASEPVSGAGSPEQAAAAGELRRAIREEVRSLSPKLRDALLLALAGEYTYEELSAMLNAPAGTIKWRVSEARRVIKQRLRDRGYGDA